MADFSPVRRRRVISAQGVVQANPGAMAAPARSLIGVGRAVNQLGSVMEEVQRQRQKVDDFRAQSESTRLIDEALSNTKLEMAQEGDRSRLPAIWERQKRLVDKQMDLSRVSPEMRVQIQEAWKHSQQKARILVQTEDVRRSLAEARSTVEKNIERLLSNGDFDSAKEQVSMARAANVYGPEEAQKRLSYLETEYDQVQARRLIEADPYKALEQLKDRTEKGNPRHFKKLDERERQAMITHARVERNRLQSDFYNQVIHASQTGELNSEERGSMWDYVQLQHSKGRLSDAQATSLHNTLVPKNNLPNWKLVQPLYAEVMAVDTAGGQYTDKVVGLRRKIAEFNLPNSERGKLLNLLEERFSSPDASPNRIEYRAAMDYAGRLLSGGMLGLEEGSGLDDPKPSEDAHKMHLNLIREIERVFKANPDARFEDVQNSIDLIRSHGMDTRAARTFMPVYGPNSRESSNPVSMDELESKLKELGE